METQKIAAEVWHLETAMTATTRDGRNRSLSIWFMDNLNPEKPLHRTIYYGPLKGLGSLDECKRLAEWIRSGDRRPRNQNAVDFIETWIALRWLDRFAAK